MNPAGRDGWTTVQQGAGGQASGGAGGEGQGGPGQRGLGMGQFGSNSQQHGQQMSGPNTGPVLPPPSGSFFSSSSQPPHNLPTLAGLGQSSQGPPSRPQATADGPHPSQPHNQPSHPGNFSLPSVGQSAHSRHPLQPHPSIEQHRDRENRERESREAAIESELAARREAEQREREMRERQHREQKPPHENHAGSIPLHQPVAVAPSVRAIHGPNGLLGGAGPASAPNPTQAGFGGPQPLFPGQSAHQGEPMRMQQAAQPAQQQLLMPFSGSGGQQPAPALNQAQQPILNDALSYLDQVKVQFAEHPDVYNRFLDIMKDFKGGVIETPGVIDRVSHLFAGSPALIQGFNTFLPPGYKIECGAGDDPNTIRVTTPMGTTMSTIPAARPFSNPRSHPANGNLRPGDSTVFDGHGRAPWQHQQQQSGQEPAFSPESRIMQVYSTQNAPSSSTQSPEIHRAEPPTSLPMQPDQRGLGHLQNAGPVPPALAMAGRPPITSSPALAAAAVAAAQIHGSAAQLQQVGPAGAIEKRGPVEFNHAISYVNKIKNRFASQPDIYKQFLEILQTYQRESKPIQDVYAQVTRLFESAPDLLEDFKQFLPESAAHAKGPGSRAAGEDAFPLSSARGDPAYSAAAMQHAHVHQTPRSEQPRLPPMGNFAPTPSANRDNKRKRGEKQAPALPPTAPQEVPITRPAPGQNNVANKSIVANGGHSLYGLCIVHPTMRALSYKYSSSVPLPSLNLLPVLVSLRQSYLFSTRKSMEVEESFLRGSGPLSAPGHVDSDDVQVDKKGHVSNVKRKRTKHQHVTKPPQVADPAPISPMLVPSIPMPMAPAYTTAPTAEDIAFFDRVKKHLNNKVQYLEFLKLINLYNQELCSAGWLVFRAQVFIGNNPELYKYFKNFLNVSEPEDEVIDAAPLPPTNKVALSNCRGLGPSYRLLPKIEQHKQCSGRDQLCNEVLNDEWVSHPTWASEDSGFVAHRKNQYEEGLHRIEEERHDYDTHIGVADRTMQLLEPIAQQLSLMAPENRAHFEVGPTLGGQSVAIPRRAIYKVYGREKGQEVEQRLIQAPYEVVPILLARLKQKREEWRAAQREWNKVWRTQVNLMFWRSLDHQGAGAKQDKRQFTTKALQQELLVREEEQRRAQNITLKPQEPYQLKLKFEDEGVICDCFSLLLIWAEQNNAFQEQPKLASFLKEYAATFFGLDPDNIRDSFIGDRVGDGGDGMDDFAGGASPRPRTSNRRAGGLIREVFTRSRNGRSTRRDGDDSVASESRASSPELQSGADEDVVAAATPPTDEPAQGKRSGNKWLDIPNEPTNGDAQDPNLEYERTTYNMYNNWNTYSFFRLFSLLYERMLKLKEWEPHVHEQVARELIQKPAHRIGWITRTPSLFFEDTSPDANYYQQMLVKFEEQITNSPNEIKTPLEETLRHFYLFVGPQLYHCDRLVAHCIKHAISIILNEQRDNSWPIWQAFKKDRPREKTTHNEEIAYRRQVEKMCRDNDIVRIAYHVESKVALIKILRRVDVTFHGTAKSPIDRWRAYIAAYSQVEPTEGVDYSNPKLKPPILRRNLPKNMTWADYPPVNLDDFYAEEEQKARVLFGSYQLEFPPLGTASVHFNTAKPSKEMLKEMAEERERRNNITFDIMVTKNKWMKADKVTDAFIESRKRAYEESAAYDPDAVPPAKRFDTSALEGWGDLESVPLHAVPEPMDESVEED